MVGEIVLWSGINAPDDSGLLLCDGSSVSSADYPALFSVIGTAFGGDGAPNFNLPDLRGKVALGQSTEFPYASSGGEAEHTLTVPEIPSHTHIDSGHTHGYTPAVATVEDVSPGVPVPGALPGASFTAMASANLSNTGGGGAHNNMQPYLALRYYIQAA